VLVAALATLLGIEGLVEESVPNLGGVPPTSSAEVKPRRSDLAQGLSFHANGPRDAGRRTRLQVSRRGTRKQQRERHTWGAHCATRCLALPVPLEPDGDVHGPYAKRYERDFDAGAAAG